jgi:UDP-glucose 4-epimerase
VIFDFLMKLKKDPRRLEILGDGTQRKSYLHVDDCVAGMLHLHKVSSRTDVFNLGNSETTSVMDIARFVVDGLGLPDVKLETTVTEGGRGWRGDVKYAQLSTEKAEKAGWKSTMSSDKSVERAVKEMISQLREQSVI